MKFHHQALDEGNVRAATLRCGDTWSVEQAPRAEIAKPGCFRAAYCILVAFPAIDYLITPETGCDALGRVSTVMSMLLVLVGYLLTPPCRLGRAQTRARLLVPMVSVHFLLAATEKWSIAAGPNRPI